ncbi:hypothetical protein F8M41_002572 [Gigaspora margarita]|uniref:Uncharacterized protein n=1 Tax=Gigaspora margarita TaxID=4874 RepID=A0A8H4AYS6_GIGMA|nr:hypothetical protein F8M41_002572 [Gigaspora margarita]
MSKKSLRKKAKKDVPSTAAGTSGASTQSSNVTEIAENVSSLQKERSISSGKINLLQKELSPELDSVTVDDITIRRHGEEIGLCPGLVVDRSFINDDETPLQIIVNAPAMLKRKHEEPGDLEKIIETVVDKALSRLKSPETIQISAEDFDPIEPISCPPFLWDAEISKDCQMSEVEKWFKDALNLPRGGTDISIGPSATSCIWIETNKNKESFKLGQAIGELLIMDNEYAPRPMSVLTDCNDNWVIFFFMEAENQEHYLASSIINDRSIALAIIKQFVLDEGRAFLEMLGKTITYQTNLPKPLKKRTKVLPKRI